MLRLVRALGYVLLTTGTVTAVIALTRQRGLLPRSAVPFIWAGLGVAVVLVLATTAFRSWKRRKDLEQRGINTVARVVHAAATGTYVNKLPEVSLELAYIVGSDLHQASVATVSEYLNLRQVEPGSYLRIRAVPGSRSNVLVLGTAAVEDAPAQLVRAPLPERPRNRAGWFRLSFASIALAQFLLVLIVFVAAEWFGVGRPLAFGILHGDPPRVLVVNELDRVWYDDLALAAYDTTTGQLMAERRMSGGLLGAKSPAVVGMGRQHLWLLDRADGLQVHDTDLNVVHTHSDLTAQRPELAWSLYQPSQFRYDGDRGAMYMQGKQGQWFRLEPGGSPERLSEEPKVSWADTGCPRSDGGRYPGRERDGTGRMSILILEGRGRQRTTVASSPPLLNPFVVMDRRCQGERSRIPLRAADNSGQGFFIVHDRSLDAGDQGRMSSVSRVNMDGEMRWTSELPARTRTSPVAAAYFVDGRLVFPSGAGPVIVDGATGTVIDAQAG